MTDPETLEILPEPLSPPVGRGRILLEQKAVPVRGDDASKRYVCAKCGGVLIDGFDVLNFHSMFPGSQVVLRCNGCNSASDATPPPLPPYHIQTDLLDHLKHLLAHSTAEANSLLTRYPELGINDPRKLVADQLLHVSSGAFLSYVNAKENLSNIPWWQAHGFQAAVSSGMAPGLLQAYETLTTASLMFFAFSLFESGLRRLVRALDPAACSGGAAEFKSIYEWLFARLKRDGWVYPPGDHNVFLDLFRTFRNTLHNNGAFYSKTGANSETTWRGIKYTFTYGAIPAFYGWEFNLLLLTELVTLNRAIMEAPTIGALPDIP